MASATYVCANNLSTVESVSSVTSYCSARNSDDISERKREEQKEEIAEVNIKSKPTTRSLSKIFFPSTVGTEEYYPKVNSNFGVENESIHSAFNISNPSRVFSSNYPFGGEHGNSFEVSGEGQSLEYSWLDFFHLPSCFLSHNKCNDCDSNQSNDYSEGKENKN